jgi:putative tricarboxylic transport membrane protein
MDETPAGDRDGDAPPIGTRGPELTVAILLMLFALGVIADSLRLGIGWAEDGPRSGYFPFYIGLLLFGASAMTAITTLLRWKRSDAVFATRPALALVISVLIPMIVYVAAISFLGIYIASALLIGYFMRRHGKFGWPFSVSISVAVPIMFFLVFERWFLVPLAKGPIEQLLGFWPAAGEPRKTNMEDLTNLLHGFSVALTLPNLGFMLIGITLGVLIGVLPGLGGANGVAILLPLTFSMNPTSAIIMLSRI